ncbi:MAG: disulfide bond formation protein DsbA [Burkholderiales bacterium 28-67-8]|nr:MAG: disulfide bond formation protein DsbA [Burkholderiales bacterium 28-67-8]
MKRREFSSHLLATAAGAGTLLAATHVHAQGEPIEGTQYVKLSQPNAVPAGKIEVVEFFWYGCPHCHAFEPALDAWQKKLPADVAFRRVPVVFREEPFTTHQRIYFTLEAMELVDAMHRKVFNAIHLEHAKLDKLPEIVAFMAKNGIDTAKFTEVFNSFSVQTKTRQAKQLAEAYRIDGVPTIGVQGRFYTSISLAGTPERALSVADFLIQRARKPG